MLDNVTSTNTYLSFLYNNKKIHRDKLSLLFGLKIIVTAIGCKLECQFVDTVSRKVKKAHILDPYSVTLTAVKWWT